MQIKLQSINKLLFSFFFRCMVCRLCVGWAVARTTNISRGQWCGSIGRNNQGEKIESEFLNWKESYCCFLRIHISHTLMKNWGNGERDLRSHSKFSCGRSIRTQLLLSNWVILLCDTRKAILAIWCKKGIYLLFKVLKSNRSLKCI